MRITIDFLKKDRRVNETFMDKLKEVGFAIEYGTYSYWNYQEYIQVGRERIFLVETCIMDNCTRLEYRYQNEVIEEIKEELERQRVIAKKADEEVKQFFIERGLSEEESIQ